jgi:small subunit ribosomal protein S20
LTTITALRKLRGLFQGLSEQAEQNVANTKSAEKAARQAESHRAQNVKLRSRMRSAIRKVVDATAAGDKAVAQASFKAAVPIIDSLVNKKVIHRNQAARHKSRLSARVKALS